MTIAEGRIHRQFQGIGYYACVMVGVTENATRESLECSPDCIAAGYDDWRRGAVAGAQYALKVAGREGCRVEITKIMGVEVDTTPAVVGAAAASAVWQAVGFVPDVEETARVERAGFVRWNPSHGAPPDFTPETVS